MSCWGLSATCTFLMVAERWCCWATCAALVASSAGVSMAEHEVELLADGCEASNSNQQYEKAMDWKNVSQIQFDDDVGPNYITEEIYVKVPRGGFGDPAYNEPNDDVKYCKAMKYLQAVLELGGWCP